jgi:transposase InsO family protein
LGYHVFSFNRQRIVLLFIFFEDIYSRKIVGYEVHEWECGERAAELIQCCMLREQCLNKPQALHSDNGIPMKAQTMKAR